MSVGDRVEIGVLTVCGLLVALLSVFFLNLYIGTVPIPVSAALAAAGNIALLHLASTITDSAWRYAPLIAFTFIVAIAMLPGIGGNGALIGDWRLLLLLFAGLGLPAVMNSMARLNRL